jgi:hypothetical protein
MDSSTQALKILLACAQRNYQTKPHSSKSSGYYWTWMPCFTCLSCSPREIGPNRWVFDYFLLKTNSVLPLLTENLLQGHKELYRSYPPRPDIPQPDHLLPSAAVEAKRTRIAQALHSSDSTEDESPLVEKEAEGEARRDNSSRPTVELTEALPLVPQGRRLVRKRKAEAIESSRY